MSNTLEQNVRALLSSHTDKQEVYELLETLAGEYYGKKILENRREISGELTPDCSSLTPNVYALFDVISNFTVKYDIYGGCVFEFNLGDRLHFKINHSADLGCGYIPRFKVIIDGEENNFDTAKLVGEQLKQYINRLMNILSLTTADEYSFKLFLYNFGAYGKFFDIE